MLWDYVSLMGTDTDLNHKPISIDFMVILHPESRVTKNIVITIKM